MTSFDSLKKIKSPASFVLGVIATFFINKYFENYTGSNSPLIVKEVKDTMKIIHSFEIAGDEKKLNKDSAYIELIKQMTQLDKVKKYQENLQHDYNSVDLKNQELIENYNKAGFNKIIINEKSILPKMLGYTTSGISSFFRANCPDINNSDEFIDIQFMINDKDIFENTTCLKTSLVKNSPNDKNSNTISEGYFYPQLGLNRISVRNPTAKGSYKLSFGLILKDDKNKEYPNFHQFVCNFDKN